MSIEGCEVTLADPKNSVPPRLEDKAGVSADMTSNHQTFGTNTRGLSGLLTTVRTVKYEHLVSLITSNVLYYASFLPGSFALQMFFATDVLVSETKHCCRIY